VSIAPASSTLNTGQPSATQGHTKPLRRDFQNLANAPTSGDLAGVKDAFSAIQQLLQGSESGIASQPQEGNKPPNQLGADLVAFGKALVSGRLGAAQDSVKSLLGDIQAARSRHQPPAQGGEDAADSVTPSTSAGRSTGSRSPGSLINTTA
jgi:hypothetical protein